MNSTATTPQPTSPALRTSQSLIDYVEANTLAAVIQALAIGFSVGIIARLIERPSREKDPAIDLKRKPTLDDAKFHLGSLILPFLWPAWQKAQETYGKSSASILDAVEKAKQSDLPSQGKKHLHEAEAWAAAEAARLATSGKKQAQAVEQCIEKEILPAAETGWKKLRKILG